MIEPLPFALSAALCVAIGLAAASLRPAWIVDHAKLVLLMLLAISASSATMLIRLDPLGFTIDVDPASEPLIRRDDPGIPIYRQATKDFGNDDVYVIAMETDELFTFENLTTLRRLTHRLRGIEGIVGAESLARVLAIHHDPERDMLSVDHLFGQVPEDPEAIAELRRRALSEPFYTKTLVSADGKSAAINITFRTMSDADFVELELDQRIQNLLDEERREGQRFYIAGRPHVRSQAYHMMVGDMARLVPIAVMIAAVALWIMWGSLWGVAIPLLACLTATLWVFGAMATLQIDINLITLVLASMMICIGSVYGVHVYARYELIHRTTNDQRTAALRCLEYTRTPVLMAGLTTCIGFAALLLAKIPATNELGAFSLLGVASVTLISLTGVPAALSLLPHHAHTSDDPDAGTPLSRAFDSGLQIILRGIGNLVVRRPGAVLAFWGVATLCAAASIPKIDIDTDVITFFKKDSRVRTDFASVNRLITGAVPIYVTVSGVQEGDFREPETLRAIERLQGRLEALPGVRQVLSSVDLIRMANRGLSGGMAEAARIPDTRAALAEATFLLPKSQLRRYLNSNHSRGNLIVRSGASGSAAVRALEERLLGVLAETDLPERFTTAVTGNVLLLNRSADGIARNQASQVGFAAATILALICIVFRSVRIGLISMIPNIVPVMLFFGTLGAGFASLSLPTSLIGSIALGIAIDDTMHFLVDYRAQRAKGLSPEEAAQRSILQVGRPIVMTTIMLVVGFLVIMASGFATLQEFGYLTALTMVLCLTTDLVLLPSLLVRLRA